MGIYRIKPLFQRFLQPITSVFIKHKVAPDWMTYSAIGVAAFMAVCIVLGRNNHWLYLLVAAGVPIRLALNALDGQVSRGLNVADTMGEVKNELGDRVADMLIFGALCFVPQVPLLVSVATLIISFLLPYLGILSKAVSGVREYNGIMGKPDRMAALAIGSLIVALSGWSQGLTLTLLAIIVLGSYSVIVRVRNIHERL